MAGHDQDLAIACCPSTDQRLAAVMNDLAGRAA